MARRRRAADPDVPPTVIPHVAPQREPPALNPIVRFFWQYGGLALGSLAVCHALYNYDSGDPKNQPRIYICFVLVIIALIVHETRPYQLLAMRCKALLGHVGLDGAQCDYGMCGVCTATEEDAADFQRFTMK